MKDEKDRWFNFLEQQAALHPDQTAVISTGGETSYRELLNRVKNFSAWLVEHGVSRETPIAVCTDRSLPWVVAALGVLYSGGMYIPMDPMAPLQRKLGLLEDIGARLVLIGPHIPAVFPSSIELVRFHKDWPVASSAGKMPEIIPAQAAYGIHTSGSSGTPKSVIVSHESLDHYASALRRELGLSSADRYLHMASLAFSASIRHLMAPLVSGATVVIATRDEIQDPASLISRMLQGGVTVFDTVPSYLLPWLAAVSESPRDWRERLASSLRIVLTTGEPLPADTVKRVRSLFPNVRVLNLYGQTETTGTVALHEPEATALESIPIGGAFDPCQFYILDEQLSPASEGELYISGPCLARGYQSRPDMTASRFLADPFSGVPGSRMYRTGDRVRRLDDGLLEFKGRTDRQVKIHGIRIELGEIDAALLAHPDLQEATAVVRPVGGQDLRLVAFVVSRPGKSSLTVEELRAFLAQSLPEAMVPGTVVFLDQLPRTASGKIDRPALMVADITPPVRKAPPAALRTQMEYLVAKCWEDTLGLTGLGVEDDFFALGGDSIQAMQMILRLQKLLPVPVPLGDLFFEDPRLKAFAGAIEAQVGA